MEQEIREAQRLGDTIRGLHLLQRSGNLNVKSIMELGATPEQFAELEGFKLPYDDYALRLAALYNHARTGGRAALSADMNHVMGVDEAQIILMFGITNFDYWQGRVMKTDVTQNYDSQLYDRDNGFDAYTQALECNGCRRCNDG